MTSSACLPWSRAKVRTSRGNRSRMAENDCIAAFLVSSSRWSTMCDSTCWWRAAVCVSWLRWLSNSERKLRCSSASPPASLAARCAGRVECRRPDFFFHIRMALRTACRSAVSCAAASLADASSSACKRMASSLPVAMRIVSVTAGLSASMAIFPCSGAAGAGISGGAAGADRSLFNALSRCRTSPRISGRASSLWPKSAAE